MLNQHWNFARNAIDFRLKSKMSARSRAFLQYIQIRAKARRFDKCYRRTTKAFFAKYRLRQLPHYLRITIEQKVITQHDFAIFQAICKDVVIIQTWPNIFHGACKLGIILQHIFLHPLQISQAGAFVFFRKHHVKTQRVDLISSE